MTTPNHPKDDISSNRKTALDVQKNPIISAAKPRNEKREASKGKEPTRFGDWEKNGRCIDF